MRGRRVLVCPALACRQRVRRSSSPVAALSTDAVTMAGGRGGSAESARASLSSTGQEIVAGRCSVDGSGDRRRRSLLCRRVGDDGGVGRVGRVGRVSRVGRVGGVGGVGGVGRVRVDGRIGWRFVGDARRFAVTLVCGRGRGGFVCTSGPSEGAGGAALEPCGYPCRGRTRGGLSLVGGITLDLRGSGQERRGVISGVHGRPESGRISGIASIAGPTDHK